MEQQEQILSELTTQLGQTSLSERTIRDYIDANMPGEGQEFDYTRHVKILTSLNGNFSHDVANKVEEFKKNYKPAQPKEGEGKKPEGAKDESSEIAKLLNRIEALEKNQGETVKITHEASLRGQVEAKIDSLKVHNKALWKDCVKEVIIDKEDTQEKVLEKVKNAYETKLKAYFGEGAAPYGGKSTEQSQSEKKKILDKRETFKARLKAQGKL